MGCLRVEVDKIPKVVVRRLSLGDFVVRFGLNGMHCPLLAVVDPSSMREYRTEVWKLDRILDEEYRDVIPDDIPNSLVRVELDSEASHVSHCIGAAPAALHRREANKNRGTPRRVREDTSMRDVRGALIESEAAEGPSSTRMDDSLRNAFMVEPVNLGSNTPLVNMIPSRLMWPNI